MFAKRISESGFKRRSPDTRAPSIGYTTGVYDLFHIGHLNLLRNAKSMCDFLLVGVSSDEHVSRYKGRKPVIPYAERAEIVRHIQYVDAVIPQTSGSKVEAWQRLKFNHLFVGDDWYSDESWSQYEEELRVAGVRITYFPYTEGTSSTLLNSVLRKLAES